MTKQLYRTRNLKMRAQFEDRALMDNRIQAILFSQPFYQNAKTIMTYLSYRSEPDTLRIVDTMLKEGKTVCAPVCRENGYMDPFLFQSISQLNRSTMGILEPPTTTQIPLAQIDLVLVPACGFNMRGHRLGYGGGYYDRFLPTTKAISCGLCYESLKTEFKEEKEDIPLNYIITEERLYSFSNT